MKVNTSAKSAPAGFYLANVGLDIGTQKNVLAQSAIRSAFAQFGYNAAILEVFPEGKSEVTALVAVFVRPVLGPDFLNDLAEVSELLEQGAIAVWHPVHNEGFLAGPKASEWGGTFNPDYFQVEAGIVLSGIPEGHEFATSANAFAKAQAPAPFGV